MAIDLERSSQLHPTGTLGMRQGWCSLKKIRLRLITVITGKSTPGVYTAVNKNMIEKCAE